MPDAQELLRQRFKSSAPATASRPSSSSRWVWPTTSTRLTTKPEQGHVALDIGALRAGAAGDPIFSPTYGEIEGIGWDADGYGLNVRIRATSGEEIVLGHLQATPSDLRIGSPVGPGQLVGLMGSTGRSTGPHLHFEVRPGGTMERFASGAGSAIGAVDPMTYYGTLPATGTKPTGAVKPSQFVYAKTSIRPTAGDAARAAVGALTGGVAPKVNIGALTGGGNKLQAAAVGLLKGGAAATIPGGEVQVASTPFGPVSIPNPTVAVGIGVALLFVLIGIYVTVKA